jgi:hydrogenase maturation protease
MWNVRPIIVVGLGNPLMGDEGVGWHLVERLSHRADLPPTIETLQAGTDLLRQAGHLHGRERVLLVDAALDGDSVGRLKLHDLPASGPCDEEFSLHQPSLDRAVGQLRCLETALERARFTLVTVAVSPGGPGTALSSRLQAALPELERMLMQELASIQVP